jgi:hypothetical protein
VLSHQITSFDNDLNFSKHKDLLLKDYWGTISYEGRFVLTGSELLQKTHGIDVIVQTNNDQSDLKIDTKHVRGNYQKLFIEEHSCSVNGREKPGWLLKEDGHPDYIIHIMNSLCRGCYHDCFACGKPIRENMIGWITPFNRLRAWYMQMLKDDAFCNEYKLFTMKQINKTTGRNVPIDLLARNVGTKQCALAVNRDAA